jgi:hypothetical protein
LNAAGLATKEKWEDICLRQNSRMQRFEKANYPAVLMNDQGVFIAGAAFILMKILCQTREREREKKQKQRW